MEEDQKILQAIEQVIIVISKQIKKDRGCGGDKLNALGRCINAYNRLSGRIREQNEDPGSFTIPRRIKKKPNAKPLG
ncbi:MAG: hypothetical protein ACYTFE_07180 [Planctomycetota bacterium]